MSLPLFALVQAVESTSLIQEARRQIWQNAMMVGLAGSLLSIVVGLFLIRRGFRPLRSIMQTVDSVDYTHLKAQVQKETRPAEL